MPIHLQSNFGMGSDFGAADYQAAVNAGATRAEIRDWAARNPNQFIGENTPGRGGLYDQVMAQATPRGTRHPDNNPVNAPAGNWIGNSNTYDPNARNYTIHRPTPAAPTKPTKQAKQSILSAPTNYAQHSSPEYTQQTYDPTLGYERYDSPGDRPYVSDYVPKQFSYYNDPSTLNAEELAYREGNIQGLDDRQNSIENNGAAADELMNNYIFRINERNKDSVDTNVGTIGTGIDHYKDSEDDDKPYRHDQWDTDKYY